MSFFRSYILPVLIVLTFLTAMLAVSARIFLPNDMVAPAPIEEPAERMAAEPIATNLKVEPLSKGDVVVGGMA
ncbi:MAG: hypothetical protein AAGF98_06615 [Cyanobacteria bacterium P01_H01_bin.153]